jgi:ADP-ribose pyrophosphatase YjhB (NUDIX family)
METELIKRYVGVVVKCEDKVLLCKRASNSELPGFWSLPAGKVGKIENAMLGAKREFFEETNISIDDKDIELVGFINRTNRDGSKVKGLMYVFMMKVDEKIYPDLVGAEDGDEHSECGYFALDELPEPMDEQFNKLLKNILTKM